MTKPLEGVKHMRREERGSVVVEASMTLVIFVTLVFSLFDFGFSLFLHEAYLNQARQGARYGAVNPSDLTAIKNVVLYNQTSGSGTGVLGLSPTSVTVARNGTAGATDDRIQVTISGYTFTFVTPGWAGNKTGQPISVTLPVEN